MNAINMQMSQQDINKLNTQVDTFNDKLKADQKIVSKNTLDEADFMKLLITQLKTQDPTKPLDDEQFIGQMTQFTSLKQMSLMTDGMQALNKGFDFSKAVALVNKNVTWMDENGKENSGIVDSIKVRDGQPLLNINGDNIELSKITEISAPPQNQATEPDSGMDQNQNTGTVQGLAQSQALSGKPGISDGGSIKSLNIFK